MPPAFQPFLGPLPPLHALALEAAALAGVSRAVGDWRTEAAFMYAADLLLGGIDLQIDGGVLRVPSASRPGESYPVLLVGGVVVCRCPANRFGGVCHHAAIGEVVWTCRAGFTPYPHRQRAQARQERAARQAVRERRRAERQGQQGRRRRALSGGRP